MVIYFSAVLLLIGGTVASSMRWRLWWIKVWDVGRFHLAFAIVVVLVIGLISPKLRASTHLLLWVILLLSLGYHLRLILPFTPFQRVEVPQAVKQDRRLRLMVANVRMKNRRVDRLLALIDQYQPHLVLLTEPDTWWQDHLAPLRSNFPYSVEEPLDNTYGMLFFSRLPLTNPEVRHLVEEGIPSVHATVVIDGGEPVQFIGLHPQPPAPWTTPENKDLELIIVAGMTNYNLLPTIVTGDLNDVGWSRITRTFKAISQMRDPRIGRGFFNTYNAKIPLGRYPIDHVFVSRHFHLVRLERLPYFGSDHFPIFIEVNLEDIQAT